MLFSFVVTWYFFERRSQEFTDIQMRKHQQREIYAQEFLRGVRINAIPWLYHFSWAMAGQFRESLDFRKKFDNGGYKDDWKIFEAACGLQFLQGQNILVGCDFQTSQKIWEYTPKMEEVKSTLRYARTISQGIERMLANRPWLLEEMVEIEVLLRRFPHYLEWLIQYEVPVRIEKDKKGEEILAVFGKYHMNNLGRMVLAISAEAEKRITGWTPHSYTNKYEIMSYYDGKNRVPEPP